MVIDKNSPPKTTGEEPCYLDPVPYKDLIDANRNKLVDRQSRTILEREKEYVKRWRSSSGAGRSVENVENTLTALALSGGGIRSATFALGVTQSLAAGDMMRRFDYLSTVSGGGYLGASLTWLARAGANAGESVSAARMDAEHFPFPVDPPGQQLGRRAEPWQDEQLIYLRQRGKYLTPGNGIDLLSAIAVLLRGFLLQLLVWVPILAALLLLLKLTPFPEVSVLARLVPDTFPADGFAWAIVAAALAAIFFVVFAVGYSFATYVTGMETAGRYVARRAFEAHMRYLLWTIVIALPVALMPIFYREAGAWLSSAGFASVFAGLGSAVATFLRLRTGADNRALTMSIVAPVGAALTIYGVLILAYAWAHNFHDMVFVLACANAGNCWSQTLWWVSLVLGLTALLSGHFVNVNLISMHRFYRDRLMEAFLPDPPAFHTDAKSVYSGLAEQADFKKLHDFDGTRALPTAPYHLLNTNVILVGSKERNWRLRGGDSFMLSPLLCGSNATGWCSTREFLGGDLTLATAMAISGAAANPYAGGALFRNRPVALLMSLANLRLGYWVSHPRRGPKKSKRRTHFSTAWREISSKLDETADLLQLSDGGHFENLGIYELIRRRVRLIVACDGTADPQFGFSDFLTLLARVSADFGARIKFDEGCGLEIFMPNTPAGFPRNAQLAKRGFTRGKISYSDGSEGDLIYVTTTLFKGLGFESLGYKAANPDFPDETTADQFFDEAQFEAYRSLGYCVGEAMLKDAECREVLKQRMGS